MCRRESQQAGRAGLLYCETGPEVTDVLASNRAARDSFRTQLDLIRDGLTSAEKLRVGIENAERQHSAIAGKATRTSRYGDDGGSGLRETRPRCAVILYQQREGWSDVARAATTEAAVHRDAEVLCKGSA